MIPTSPIVGLLDPWVGTALRPLLDDGTARNVTRIHLSITDVGQDDVIVDFSGTPITIPSGQREVEQLVDINLAAGDDLVQTVQQGGTTALNLSGWFTVVGVGISPGAAITTLDRVKAELKISGAQHDALLTALINGVASQFDEYTQRTLTKTAITDTLSASGMPGPIPLSNSPVETVTSCQVAGADQEYSLDQKTGLIWPASSGVVGAWPRGTRHIVVAHESGYDPMPEALVDVATAQVCHNFRKTDAAAHTGTRGRESIAQETGGQTNYQTEPLLPEVRLTLDMYRRWR